MLKLLFACQLLLAIDFTYAVTYRARHVDHKEREKHGEKHDAGVNAPESVQAYHQQTQRSDVIVKTPGMVLVQEKRHRRRKIPWTELKDDFLSWYPAQDDQENWIRTSRQAMWLGIFVMLWAVLSILCASFFVAAKNHPPPPRQGPAPTVVDGIWKYSVFACCDDPLLCGFATFCGCVLWADTMRMIRFFHPPRFCQAFLVFLILVLLIVLTIFMSKIGFGDGLPTLNFLLLICMLVYTRQSIRAMFNMPNCTLSSIGEDCCVYCFCSVCALIQEARQVDDGWQSRHPSLTYLEGEMDNGGPPFRPRERGLQNPPTYFADRVLQSPV